MKCLDSAQTSRSDIMRRLAELGGKISQELDYYPFLIEQVLAGTSGVAAFLWQATPEGSIKVLQVRSMANSGRNTLLPGHAIRAGRTLRSGIACEAALPTMAEFPCKQLIALSAPLPKLNLMIEVWIPEETPSHSRFNQLQFLMQMGKLATRWVEKNTRSLNPSPKESNSWTDFSYQIHRSLKLREVAYILANEAIPLTGAERVQVAVRQGNRWRILAISGREDFDARATPVRSAEQLTHKVLSTAEPLWSTAPETLSPQIAEPLEAYLEASQTRFVGVLPLIPTCDSDLVTSSRDTFEQNKRCLPIGALIVESFTKPLTSSHRQSAQLVALHGTTALSNALAHESIWFLPFWTWLGQWRANLPSVLKPVLLVLFLLLGLILIPVDFSLTAVGELEPVSYRHLFSDNGIVEKVCIQHGERVSPGQVLVVLRNDELQQEWLSLKGQLQETQQRLAALQTSLLKPEQLPVERQQLAAEVRRLQRLEQGLGEQTNYLQSRLDALQIKSPISGEILTWDVQEKLHGRPVQRGQVLLSIGDLSGEWKIRGQLSESQVGKLWQAQQEYQRIGQPQPVSFLLVTDPTQTWKGHLAEISSRVEFHEHLGHTLRFTTCLNDSRVPPKLLQVGTQARLQVYCGRRPAGYVWLHGVWEWVQREIFFRFNLT